MLDYLKTHASRIFIGAVGAGCLVFLGYAVIHML